MHQITLPWVPGVEPKNQPRFAHVEACEKSKVYGDYNDWILVELVPKAGASQEELNEADGRVLLTLQALMFDKISAGEFGAIGAADEDGFYLVKWTGAPYVLQEDKVVMDGTCHLVAGDMACKGTYLTKLYRTKDWYTPTPTVAEAEIEFPLKYVLLTGIEMKELSTDNPLPKNAVPRTKQDAKNLGAMRIPESSLQEIDAETARRAMLDYEETIDAPLNNNGVEGAGDDDEEEDDIWEVDE